MKNIFKIMGAAAVSLLFLASCDQENVKSIYTPEQDNEVSFQSSVYTNTEIPAEATSIDIIITRNSANGSITVPLSDNLSSEITVPSEVVFQDGEYEAAITLGLAIQGGIRYTGTIAIADSAYFNAETSPYPSIDLSLQQAYNWESIGEGQWWDNMITHPVVVPVEVMQATNSATPRYRIMHPFTDEVLQAFADVQGGRIDNNNRSEYIEFAHLADESGAVTPLISFDTFYPGVSLSPVAGDEGPVEGIFSADYANQCGLVQDNVYQFYPYYQFTIGSGATYSWGTALSAYLSLPGGPNLADLLGL